MLFLSASIGIMKTTTVLRIVHMLALAVGVLAFGVATWRWFVSRFPFDDGLPLGELANFGGLVIGFGLGIVLLWSALRPTRRTMKTAMILYAAWISIFAWYWFNSFTLNEVHSFDPQRIAREEAQHVAISICFFLLWVGLYSIGPVLTAHRLRH
jgi:hypothetical protein